MPRSAILLSRHSSQLRAFFTESRIRWKWKSEIMILFLELGLKIIIQLEGKKNILNKNKRTSDKKCLNMQLCTLEMNIKQPLFRQIILIRSSQWPDKGGVTIYGSGGGGIVGANPKIICTQNVPSLRLEHAFLPPQIPRTEIFPFPTRNTFICIISCHIIHDVNKLCQTKSLESKECGASITCNAMKSGAVCPGQ